MSKRFPLSALIAATVTLLYAAPHCLQAQTPVQPPARTPVHTDNGVFLTHNYVSYTSWQPKVADLAEHMQEYSVTTLYVNCTSLNRSGGLQGGAAKIAAASSFLNRLKAWETSHRYTFKVCAWLSGTTNPADSNFVALTNVAIQQNIARECAKFTSATVPGTYVPGATRTFDGVVLDFEPAGGNPPLFKGLESVMDQIKGTIGRDKQVGFTAPKYSASHSPWTWSSAEYYAMAQHVDFIDAMTYDTGITTPADFTPWMTAQVSDILKSVSGALWNYDAAHPAPIHGVKVLFGFSAFPPKRFHHIGVENVPQGAAGVLSGLAGLDARTVGCFEGAFMYLNTDGTGSDGFASYATDWAEFQSDWVDHP